MDEKVLRYFDRDRFAAHVGGKLLKVEPGYALAKMEVGDRHLNAANIIHGGALFTLGDLAVAAASNAHGQVAVGISANILFFKPSKGKVLFAEAKESSFSRKIANYHVKIYDDNGEDIAQLNITCYKKEEKISIE